MNNISKANGAAARHNPRAVACTVAYGAARELDGKSAAAVCA